MHAAAHRLEFAPPPTAGLVRALGLAILAHAVLVAALTWGVQWKRSAELVAVEAELWSALPQQAAPKLVEAPPAPPPVPPAPAPEPVAPKAAEPDIALEREKARLQKEKQLAAQLEQEKRAQQKLARDQQRALEEKKRAQEETKRAQEQKLAADRRKNELEARRKQAVKAEQEAALLEAQRQAIIQRSVGMAGATGAATATGTAAQSSGPSTSYAGRLTAKVRPNIVFTEDPPGNPTAEVEVTAAPDGTIVRRRIVKSSGNKAWDEAVLKAIDKTETLPRDVDGRVPASLIISFRRFD